MQTLDSHLIDLWREGKIAYEELVTKAQDTEEIMQQIRSEAIGRADDMAEYSDMFLEELVRAGLAGARRRPPRCIDEHERTGKPTKDIALEMALITEDQSLDLIAQLLGAERVDLEHMSVDRRRRCRRCRAAWRACTT